MLKTVPLDRTGTQPRPRQAKAMVSSCLLSLLLFLFFVSLSVAPPFLLQAPCHLSLNNTTLFAPADLCENIPVQVEHPDQQHLQTQTLPPSPPLPPTCCPCSLLPSADPKRHRKEIFLICPRDMFDFGLAESDMTSTRNDAPTLRHKLKHFPVPSLLSL